MDQTNLPVANKKRDFRYFRKNPAGASFGHRLRRRRDDEKYQKNWRSPDRSRFIPRDDFLGQQEKRTQPNNSKRCPKNTLP